MNTLLKKLHPTDAIGRRNRYLPFNNPNKRITDRVLKVAQYNHMMGGEGLPSPQLFNAGTHTNFHTFENWLSRIRGKVFDVGPWQLERSQLNSGPIINRNNQAADTLLRERGMFYENVPERSGAPKHDAFLSFGYCSFYETAPHGWTVELQHSILNRLGISQEITLPSGKKGKPDAICIVSNSIRTIVVFQEYDRATQPMRAQKNVRESWESKLSFYEELIETKYYRELFKLPDRNTGALLCAMTVDQTNMHSMLKVKQKPWFLVQAHPEFGYDFCPPRKLYDVYNDPWYRAGEPYIFAKAGEGRSVHNHVA